jgi:uncharacterized protein
MKKNDIQIKKLLSSLQEEFAGKLIKTKSSTPRNYQFPNIDDKTKVAIGMRRTGKSYFLLQNVQALLKQQISQSQILFLNFEDDRLLPSDQTDLALLVDKFYEHNPENHDRRCYFFFDEIQNVEGWPIVIRRLLESKNVEIYLSGSSAKLLSKEIATSLRGRSVSIEIWPYSFSEFLIAKKIPAAHSASQKEHDKLKKTFEGYLQAGGFPEVTHLDLTDRNRILQDYLEVVTFRDIIERHNIKNITLIKYLLKFLLNNAGGSFSVNKIFNDLKSQGFAVAKNTLYDYFSHIEDAFIAFLVPLFSNSIRKTNSNPKKIYTIDSGLVNACSFKTSKDWGHLFENLIYLDLRRQEKKIYYYLTQDRFEVDFLTENLKGERELIQVVWDTSDDKTMARETRALEQAKKELKLPGKIITPDSYLEKYFP